MANYKRKYSREQLVELLKKLGNELGRSPRTTDVDKTKGYPNSSTYYLEFFTWNGALKEAGLKVYRRNKKNV